MHRIVLLLAVGLGTSGCVNPIVDVREVGSSLDLDGDDVSERARRHLFPNDDIGVRGELDEHCPARRVLDFHHRRSRRKHRALNDVVDGVENRLDARRALPNIRPSAHLRPESQEGKVIQEAGGDLLRSDAHDEKGRSFTQTFDQVFDIRRGGSPNDTALFHRLEPAKGTTRAIKLLLAIPIEKAVIAQQTRMGAKQRRHRKNQLTRETLLIQQSKRVRRGIGGKFRVQVIPGNRRHDFEKGLLQMDGAAFQKGSRKPYLGIWGRDFDTHAANLTTLGAARPIRVAARST